MWSFIITIFQRRWISNSVLIVSAPYRYLRGLCILLLLFIHFSDLLSDGDTITIQSPQYPARYPNNTVVQWLFQAEEGHHFELTFPEFDLEEFYDYLTVGNGSHIGGLDETVFSLTGFRPEPVIAVNNNAMWMEFSSDSIISGDGFVVEIHVVEDVRKLDV